MRPADVGLPAGTRRRTPGLRRSELATLSGISVEYLTRLEQGRDQRPSTQVLAALAQALHLTDADREHLQELSNISHGTELCAAARDAARTVRPTTRAILERLDPTPACVVNHLADLLAWNTEYDHLVRPLGILNDPNPNLLRFAFTHPGAKDAFQDWDDMADHQVARLHQLRNGDPAVEILAAELAESAGAQFAQRWQRRPVSERPSRVTALEHPQVGTLRLSEERLRLADRGQQDLIIYLPADAATSTGLDRLAGRHPGALRAVTT